MADFENTVIINVDLTPDDAARKAEGVAKSIADIKKEQDALKKSNLQTSASYTQNQQQIQRLQRELKAYVNISQQANGSNNQMRAQLSLLNSQYDALSKAERESSSAGITLTAQIKALNAELLKSEGQTGRNQRNVGNYAGALNAASQAGLPFTGSILSSLDALGSFTGILSQAKVALDANTEATQLLAIATQEQAKATAAATRSEELKAEATIARARAEQLSIEASAERARADALQVQITNQLVAAEEREALITEQLVLEQRALLAEDIALVAAQEALTVTTLEVAAAEEAQALAATSAATATAAQGAASTATAAKVGILKTAASAGVFAALIVGITSVIGYLIQFDSIGDTVERKLGGLKNTFLEFGKVITDVFSGREIGEFGDRLAKARDEGEKFAGVFQELEDQSDVGKVLTERATAEVDNLRLRARNLSLSNTERQKLLDEANRIEEGSLKRTESYYSNYINAATNFANKDKTLTKQQVERLKQGDVELANSLLNQDKITKDGYEKLTEAFSNQIAARRINSQRLEKIQNDQDKYAERQAALDEKRNAEAEKRQAAIDKVNEDRAKSELVTAGMILTIRQKEFEEINADIDKRLVLYRKYGQDTTQLENERLSRIQALGRKFAQDDLKVIQGNLNDAERLRIATIKDSTERQQAQQNLDNQIALDAVDLQIAQVASRSALGEQGLTDLLQSFVDKRNGIVNQANFQREQFELESQQRLAAIQAAGEAEDIAYQQRELERLYATQEAKLAIDAETTRSYQDVFGTISELAGKESALAKASFALQKAFAIAEIAINAQREIAAVNLRYETLKTYAALVPIAGPAIIGALSVAQGIETGRVIGRAVISGAIVAAQAIASLSQGFATGGYVSGAGTGKSDSIPARLSNGESVINAKSTAMFRPLLSDLNVAGGGRAFATGGYVGNSSAGSYISGLSAGAGARMQQDALLQAIINRPVVVDVKDIVGGIEQRAEVVDAGNF